MIYFFKDTPPTLYVYFHTYSSVNHNNHKNNILVSLHIVIVFVLVESTKNNISKNRTNISAPFAETRARLTRILCMGRERPTQNKIVGARLHAQQQ